MTLSPESRRGVLILGIVVVFVLAVVGTLLYQRYTRPHVGSDNCVYADKWLRKRAPAEQAVILVDQSEALTLGHMKGVVRDIETFVLDDVRFPVGSRVLMFTFSKDDFSERGRAVPSFQPIVDICKPKPEGNPLSENNRKIRDNFLRAFIQPLRENLAKELSKEVGERSPILETLQMISRSQDVGAWDKRKTLLVVSDMLQHTQSFSHYRAPSHYEEFQRRYAPQVTPDFRGWEIVLLYLRRYRDRHLQQRPHVEFWQRYFSDYGGKITRIEGFD